MQPEQINSSDLLDILFADRNKSYGAYILRRGYNKRLAKALIITAVIIVLALVAYYFSGNDFSKEEAFKIAGTVILQKVEPPAEPEPPVPPPPPPPPPAPQVSMRQFTTPVIVDENVKENEMPPVEELATSVIGTINQEGEDDPYIIAPPINNNAGVIETPKQKNENDNGFVPVEIESTYPGGMPAWRRFLIKTLNYPEEAKQNEIRGRVTVKFIVDGDGRVSNIEAISGPEELRSEAVRVIGKSGKWTPAVQNGNYVKSIKLQQIIFTLQNE
jgi:periplasmic protein TonB